MRLFISYSHRDMDRVETLQAALNAMGHTCVRDEDFMRSDTKWRDQIERIIRTHDAVIYAVSPAAMKSAEVHDEIEKANKYHKPILHVKVASFDDPTDPMPRALDQFHLIDATSGVTDKVSTTLRRDLSRLVNDRLVRRGALAIVGLLVAFIFLFAARDVLPAAMPFAFPPTFVATGNPMAGDILLIMTSLDKTSTCPTEVERAVENKINDAVTQTTGARLAKFRDVVPDEATAQKLSDQWSAVIVVWGSCDDVAVKLNYTLSSKDLGRLSGPSQQSRSVTEDELKAVGGESPRLLKSWVTNNDEPDYVLNFVAAQLAGFSRQYDAALASLNKAIDFGNQMAGDDIAYARQLQLDSAYFFRGYLLALQNKYPEALKDYDKAIEFNPQDDVAFYNRGVLKSALGDKQGAIQDYDHAISINPTNTDAYYNRGNTKSALQDYKNALADYSSAINLDPQFANAYSNRAFAKLALNDLQGSLQDCNSAIQLDPQNAYAYFTRGTVNRRLRNFTDALADFRKYVELVPDNPEGRARIGEIEDILTPQPPTVPPVFFASPTFVPTRTPKASAIP